MQMLYNSDSYVVVRFEVPLAPTAGAEPALTRGGFEIVDKFAGKEIYLEGALAERFQRGVQDLVATRPDGATPEELDQYISGYTAWAQQDVTLH